MQASTSSIYSGTSHDTDVYQPVALWLMVMIGPCERNNTVNANRVGQVSIATFVTQIKHATH